MQTNLIIVDDFLNNPHEVREYALAQEFTESGNYPGKRTEPDENESVLNTIKDILRPHAGEVTQILGKQYQHTTSAMKSWVHADTYNTWAAVLYLTPDAPPCGGTGLFRHKETGLYSHPRDNPRLADEISADGSDMSKWELVELVANKFNRLVLYRGDLYHSSMNYFGRTWEDGRLFQVFFITTEN
ncbi:MAG: hypothetical protein JXR12_05735 [Neptunomonas phycophila]|uniref:DUF6445 family protein n=1 Tax=Neptunomonas phycophila TaxID=1572645 RepID=UPI003B8DF453